MTEYLTTKELAELLRIKERKVYDLAASGSVPCSRATGKLLFPRDAVNAWLESHASNLGSTSKSRPLVIIGSHDPLLEWALRESRCGLASYLDSSLDGLDRFEQGDGIASGLHVYDSESNDWNTPLVKSRLVNNNFASSGVVLVEWAKRERGMIVNPDRVEEYQSLQDMQNKTVVPRQQEAGSQVLLEALIAEQSVDVGSINWTAAARSEMDAVVDVLEGKADLSFGLSTLAAQVRLGFIPVIEERYDLLVDRQAWFEPTWQKFIQFCRSKAFANRANELTGYNLAQQFSVHFNSE
ncbi:MAG: putative molybdopterin biosynthesis protein [Urechidicola sp.]